MENNMISEEDKIFPEIVNLRGQIDQLRLRADMAEKRLNALDEKRKKTAKGEFNGLALLTEMKQAFLDTHPHERDTPFDDNELVFWSFYVLSGTGREQRLTSYKELNRRKKAIKWIVDAYKNKAEQDIHVPKENAEVWARNKAKLYIEFMLTSIKLYNKKTGTEEFATIYQIASDWIFNQYAQRLVSWQQIQNLNDSPAME